MLMLGQQIRLTPAEQQQLLKLTGVAPGPIKILSQLQDYIHSQVTRLDLCRREACLPCRVLHAYLPGEIAPTAPALAQCGAGSQ